MRRKCRIWISMLVTVCVLLTSMSVCRVVAFAKEDTKAQEEMSKSTEEEEGEWKQEGTDQNGGTEEKEMIVEEDQEAVGTNRNPIYDIEEIHRIFNSIPGMGRQDSNKVKTYRAAAGQMVQTKVLRMDIGTISMIRYTDTGWENVREWSEGLLGTSNGEWVYCADPNVDFQAGTKTCYNATDFYTAETVKTIGMMFYYFDTNVKCNGMSDADIYLMKQCMLWSVLNPINGWMQGITLEYGNGMQDGLGHWLADHLGGAIWEGASWAADSENRRDFQCSGVIMKGNGQDLSQWKYEYNPKGKLCIQKSSDNVEVIQNNKCYSLAGAEYGVYADKECKTLVATLKTDESGKSNTVELAKATYYLKETKAPKGFAIDTTIYNVTVISKETNILKVSDKPQVNPVDIVLEKRDHDTNGSKPSGSASLENAEFTVKYYDGYYDTDPALQGKPAARTWKLKTDVNGKVKMNDNYKISGDVFFTDSSGKPSFPLGTVTVRETKAPKGYLTNQEVFIKKITSDGTKETLAVYTVPTVKEKVIRGDVQLTKFAEGKDPETEKKVPLEGINFKLTSKTNGQSWTIVTDKNGFASTKQLKLSNHGNLPYDTYIISEENTPKGFKKIEDFEVTISKDNQSLSYILENKLILSPVRLVKKDVETGNVVPVSGAEFQLLDENKNVITMNTYYPKKEQIDIFKTDATGDFVLPEKLKVGIYYFHEITAPIGYLKGEDVQFEITEGHNWEDPFVVEFPDRPVHGKMEILKKDTENGDILSDAAFEVTAAEDILAGDGTVIFEAGDVVANIETGEDGRAVLDGLHLGIYSVREVKAPEGHLLSEEKYTIKLEYEDQTVPIVVETVEVENRPTRIKLIKTDRESGTPLEKVTFNIWNKELGEETAKEYVTDRNGLIEIHRLAAGIYCIQEAQTLPGYVLDPAVYEIKISEDGKIDGKEMGILELTNSPTLIIGTKAKDEVGIVRKAMVQIDEVEIKNLQIGQNYLLKGIIMDKATKQPLLINGKTVTAEKKFTALTKDDTVEVEYQYDGRHLYGKNIVFFEKLYVEFEDGLTEISVHEDMNDEKQTLIYPEKVPAKGKTPEKAQPEKIPDKETSAAKTGDLQKPWGMVLLMTVSGGIFISVFRRIKMRKRKNYNQKK